MAATLLPLGFPSPSTPSTTTTRPTTTTTSNTNNNTNSYTNYNYAINTNNYYNRTNKDYNYNRQPQQRQQPTTLRFRRCNNIILQRKRSKLWRQSSGKRNKSHCRPRLTIKTLCTKEAMGEYRPQSKSSDDTKGQNAIRVECRPLPLFKLKSFPAVVRGNMSARLIGITVQAQPNPYPMSKYHFFVYVNRTKFLERNTEITPSLAASLRLLRDHVKGLHQLYPEKGNVKGKGNFEAIEKT